jgi:hypothetical protein
MDTGFSRAVADDGTELHLIPMAPQALPRVQKRDLEQAWEAATDAARAGFDGPRRGFRFAEGASLALNDRDARSWAAAIDRAADLSTAHGVSVCLRLLALIDLIGRASWLTPFVRAARGRDSAWFDGGLLQAASITRLTAAGGLDEAAMRAMLLNGESGPPGPRVPDQERRRCSA